MALHKKCVLTDSIKVAHDTPANRFVTLSGARPAEGAHAYGVTAAAAGAGGFAPVDALGTTIVESTAAAIEVGAAVSCAAPGDDNADAGKVLEHADDAKIVGRARTAVPAAGGLLEIFLIPN